MVGEGRRKIQRGKPTTGDGQKGGRKPKLSETKGVPVFGESKPSRLRLPKWLIGRHRKAE